MVRRKVPRYALRAASTTSNSPPTKDYISAYNYYNRRYKEVDKKRRFTRLYEDSKELYINRIEGL